MTKPDERLSWWCGAPRESFTRTCWLHWPDMVKSEGANITRAERQSWNWRKQGAVRNVQAETEVA